MIMTIRNTLAIGALNLVSLAACSHTTPGLSSDSGSTLIAYAGATTDIPGARPPAVRPAVVVERVPEATLRDLTKMVEVRDWMRRQIVNQTRNVPEERYQRLVRPQVKRQLRAIGLDDRDITYILQEVDYTRGLQGHHQARSPT
jgi:hypothetical protein